MSAVQEQKAELNLPRAEAGFLTHPGPGTETVCLMWPGAGGGRHGHSPPPPGSQTHKHLPRPPSQGHFEGPGEVPPTPLTTSLKVGTAGLMSQMGKLRL